MALRALLGENWPSGIDWYIAIWAGVRFGRPGEGDPGGRAVPALLELGGFRLVAFLAHRGGGVIGHIGALMRHGARKCRGDLVAVAAAHLIGGHAAVAKLLDNSRRRVAVAGHAGIGAVGQGIHRGRGSQLPRGLQDEHGGNQADDHNGTEQAEHERHTGPPGGWRIRIREQGTSSGRVSQRSCLVTFILLVKVDPVNGKWGTNPVRRDPAGVVAWSDL